MCNETENREGGDVGDVGCIGERNSGCLVFLFTVLRLWVDICFSHPINRLQSWSQVETDC